jgi:hypothetical protein
VERVRPIAGRGALERRTLKYLSRAVKATEVEIDSGYLIWFQRLPRRLQSVEGYASRKRGLHAANAAAVSSPSKITKA